MKEIGYLTPWELMVVVRPWKQRGFPKMQKKEKEKRKKKSPDSEM